MMHAWLLLQDAPPELLSVLAGPLAIFVMAIIGGGR